MLYLPINITFPLCCCCQGLLSNDSVLAGALWRTIFVKRDIEAQQMADMVEYVRQQVC